VLPISGNTERTLASVPGFAASEGGSRVRENSLVRWVQLRGDGARVQKDKLLRYWGSLQLPLPCWDIVISNIKNN